MSGSTAWLWFGVFAITGALVTLLAWFLVAFLRDEVER